MERIKFYLRALVFVIAGLFLHYVLPQHDVVKLTSTEIIRTDFSGFNRIFYAQADSGAVEQPTRDLRLINTDRKRHSCLALCHGMRPKLWCTAMRIRAGFGRHISSSTVPIFRPKQRVLQKPKAGPY